MENKDAQAQVRQSGFHWIWLLPVAALLIVIWMGWRNFAVHGPTIKIIFSRAGGVEAGRTPIRLKDVDVGIVKAIELSKDLKQVIVTAEMSRTVEDYLTDNTEFWIARPRLSSNGITGLDTLVSGAYIIMKPGQGDEQHEFTALNEPPMDEPDAPGHRFTMHAARLSTLAQGSPLYYRGLEVGFVEGYRLNEKGDDISIYTFVRAPYDKLVTNETHFWNASTIEIASGPNGIEIKTESLRALLTGGIAFETPLEALGTEKEAPTKDFVLYDSIDAARLEPRGPHFSYLVHFVGSVHGLAKGAPVELKGIRVGQVSSVVLDSDSRNGTVKTPVTIDLEVGRLKLAGVDAMQTGQAQFNQNLDRLIQKGLRAELATSSLITGQRFVSLMVEPEAPAEHLIMGGAHPEIPSMASGNLDDVTRAATTTLNHVDKVAQNLEKLTGPSELQHTVEDLDRLLSQFNSNSSPLGRSLPQTLDEVKDAARSLRVLMDYLDQHPEALLRGRGGSD